MLAKPHHNNLKCSAVLQKFSTWTDPWAGRKHWKRDMTFGSWSVKSLYWAGSFMTVAKELVRFRLDLVGVK